MTTRSRSRCRTRRGTRRGCGRRSSARAARSPAGTEGRMAPRDDGDEGQARAVPDARPPRRVWVGLLPAAGTLLAVAGGLLLAVRRADRELGPWSGGRANFALSAPLPD